MATFLSRGLFCMLALICLFGSAPTAYAGATSRPVTPQLLSQNGAAFAAPPQIQCVLGDSRAYDLGGVYAGGTSNDPYRWVSALSGGRILVPGPARSGFSGQTSAYIADPTRMAGSIARFMAAGCDTVNVIDSTNDWASLTAAQTIAALKTQESMLLAAGFKVNWLNEYPRGDANWAGVGNPPSSPTFSAANLAKHLSVHRWINSRVGHLNVTVTDSYNALADRGNYTNSSNGWATLGELGDGTHTGTSGAIHLAQAFQSMVQYRNAPSLTYDPVSVADSYDSITGTGTIVSNPGLLGTGGTLDGGTGVVATNWKAGNPVPTGITATYSKVTVGGRDIQQVVLSGTAPGAVVQCHASGTTLTIESVTQGTVAAGEILKNFAVSGSPTITSGSGTTWTLSSSQTLANGSTCILDASAVWRIFYRDTNFGTNGVAAGNQYQMIYHYQTDAGTTGVYKINGYLNDSVNTFSTMDANVSSPNTYGVYPTDALDATVVGDPVTIGGNTRLRTAIEVGLYPGATVNLTMRILSITVMPWPGISFNDGRLPIDPVNDNFGDADALAA